MKSTARVLTCYYRPNPGGLCRRLVRAMEALAEAGHEVHYLAVEELPARHPSCHFHRLPVPTGRRRGPFFWTVFALLAPPALLALAWRHRVTAAFAFGSPYGALMQPVRLLRRVPLVLFLRGDPIPFHRLRGRRGLARLEHALEGLALSGARVYGVSRDLARRVVGRHRWLRPAAWGVLPNDLPEVPAGLEAAGGGAMDRQAPLHLFAAGVLYPTKNLDLLLDALALLPPGRVRLTLYGEGPHRRALEARAQRLGLGAEAVSFAGWVEPAEVWSRPGVLAMPSRDEGAPNAVLEALARRVPVLASDIPAHREILPPEGLLPVDEPAAWARRWQVLLDDPAELEHLVERQGPVADRLRFDWGAEVCRAILQPARHGAPPGTAS